ncbi:MAG: TolC family protein [Nitrospiraceae bacterium]|nr:TolC family protein [Nitrospiraceae bacterium]
MHFSLSRDRYLALFIAITIVLCLRINAESRDLGEILVQVEQHTPTLQAAHARTVIKQATKRQAKSHYFGEVNALVRNSNYDSARLINPISYPVKLQSKLFDNNQIACGLNARIPLDINGRIAAGVDAAGKQVKAARAQAANVRLQILHGAADLYHRLEGVKALEGTLQKQILALTAHIKVATVSIEAGRTAPVEKLRLVANKESVKGKLAALQGQAQGIRARLAALMGTESFPDPVFPIHDPPKNTCEEAIGLMNRPDIHALLFQCEAAEADVRAAEADRFPELNIDGSWIQNQGFNGEGDNTWALFVQLQLPLWDGGNRRSAIAKAEAGRSATRYQLAALRNQAKAELVAAKAGRQAAKISYKATVASVNAARETARIQTDRFSEGRLSAADLVDAEAALAGARSSRALALTYWWLAENRIRLAVGLEPSSYHTTKGKP